MSSDDFRTSSSDGYQPLPGPGYTGFLCSSSQQLSLRVDDLADIHYIAQPRADMAVSLIRFKSGEMFSSPFSIHELAETIRRQELFLIAAVPNHESTDLATATIGIIQRNPHHAIIDVGAALNSPMTLYLNPAEDAPRHRVLADDTLANCVQEPGKLRRNWVLDDASFGRVQARLVQAQAAAKNAGDPRAANG